MGGCVITANGSVCSIESGTRACWLSAIVQGMYVKTCDQLTGLAESQKQRQDSCCAASHICYALGTISLYLVETCLLETDK